MESIHSVYVVGESRTNIDNAITKTYGSFFMAFEIDDVTYEIIDFSCTHTIGLTERYLSKLFIGKKFPDISQWLERELQKRYIGSSRKAVIVAYNEALKRWKTIVDYKEEF